MSNSFYLTLPSNVSGLSDNTISDYLTRLPKTLRLSDDYQVALTEITYTKSWYNVRDHDIHFTLYIDGKMERSARGFPPGYYASIDELIASINEFIRVTFVEEEGLPELQILQTGIVRMVFAIDLDGRRKDIDLGPELESLLGFSDRIANNVLPSDADMIHTGRIWSTPEEMNLKYRQGERFPDIKAGIHSLFVYTDIVSPSIVGDTYANFLRSVAVHDNSYFGNDIHVVFQKPYYQEISIHDINSIRINIKDDAGQPINFLFGRVCVTLHFRKVWKAII